MVEKKHIVIGLFLLCVSLFLLLESATSVCIPACGTCQVCVIDICMPDASQNGQSCSADGCKICSSGLCIARSNGYQCGACKSCSGGICSNDNSKTSLCADDEKCVAGVCTELSCSACNYASNHNCVTMGNVCETNAITTPTSPYEGQIDTGTDNSQVSRIAWNIPQANINTVKIAVSNTNPPSMSSATTVSNHQSLSKTGRYIRYEINFATTYTGTKDISYSVLYGNTADCTSNNQCSSNRCCSDYDGSGNFCCAANTCVHNSVQYTNTQTVEADDKYCNSGSWTNQKNDGNSCSGNYMCKNNCYLDYDSSGYFCCNIDCVHNSVCYANSDRVGTSRYCESDSWKTQKNHGTTCNENYQCKTNHCHVGSKTNATQKYCCSSGNCCSSDSDCDNLEHCENNKCGLQTCPNNDCYHVDNHVCVAETMCKTTFYCDNGVKIDNDDDSLDACICISTGFWDSTNKCCGDGAGEGWCSSDTSWYCDDGSKITEPDDSTNACDCLSTGNWDSVQKCCGDDGATDTWCRTDQSWYCDSATRVNDPDASQNACNCIEGGTWRWGGSTTKCCETKAGEYFCADDTTWYCDAGIQRSEPDFNEDTCNCLITTDTYHGWWTHRSSITSNQCCDDATDIFCEGDDGQGKWYCNNGVKIKNADASLESCNCEAGLNLYTSNNTGELMCCGGLDEESAAVETWCSDTRNGGFGQWYCDSGTRQDNADAKKEYCECEAGNNLYTSLNIGNKRCCGGVNEETPAEETWCSDSNSDGAGSWYCDGGKRKDNADEQAEYCYCESGNTMWTQNNTGEMRCCGGINEEEPATESWCSDSSGDGKGRWYCDASVRKDNADEKASYCHCEAGNNRWSQNNTGETRCCGGVDEEDPSQDVWCSDPTGDGNGIWYCDLARRQDDADLKRDYCSCEAGNDRYVRDESPNILANRCCGGKNEEAGESWCEDESGPGKGQWYCDDGVRQNDADRTEEQCICEAGDFLYSFNNVGPSLFSKRCCGGYAEENDTWCENEDNLGSGLWYCFNSTRQDNADFSQDACTCMSTGDFTTKNTGKFGNEYNCCGDDIGESWCAGPWEQGEWYCENQIKITDADHAAEVCDCTIAFEHWSSYNGTASNSDQQICCGDDPGESWCSGNRGSGEWYCNSAVKEIDADDSQEACQCMTENGWWHYNEWTGKTECCGDDWRRNEMPWWNNSWKYRQTVALSFPTEIKNYQLQIDIDGLNPLFLDIKGRNGEDIRFVDGNNNILNYWIEKWRNGGKTIIWVLLPDIGTEKIYLYYGNRNATAMSDGDGVFEFFDDFTGNVINSTKWVAVNTGPTVSQDNSLIFKETGYAWDKALISTQNITRSENKLLQARVTPGTYTSFNHIMIGWEKANYATAHYNQLVHGFYFVKNTHFYDFEYGNYIGALTFNHPADTEFNILIELKDVGARYYAKGGDYSVWTMLRETSVYNDPVMKIAFIPYAANMKVHNIFVRNYVLTEPVAILTDEREIGHLNMGESWCSTQAQGYCYNGTWMDRSDYDEELLYCEFCGFGHWNETAPYLGEKGPCCAVKDDGLQDDWCGLENNGYCLDGVWHHFYNYDMDGHFCEVCAREEWKEFLNATPTCCGDDEEPIDNWCGHNGYCHHRQWIAGNDDRVFSQEFELFPIELCSEGPDRYFNYKNCGDFKEYDTIPGMTLDLHVETCRDFSCIECIKPNFAVFEKSASGWQLVDNGVYDSFPQSIGFSTHVFLNITGDKVMVQTLGPDDCFFLKINAYTKNTMCELCMNIDDCPNHLFECQSQYQDCKFCLLNPDVCNDPLINGVKSCIGVAPENTMELKYRCNQCAKNQNVCKTCLKDSTCREYYFYDCLDHPSECNLVLTSDELNFTDCFGGIDMTNILSCQQAVKSIESIRDVLCPTHGFASITDPILRTDIIFRLESVCQDIFSYWSNEESAEGNDHTNSNFTLTPLTVKSNITATLASSIENLTLSIGNDPTSIDVWKSLQESNKEYIRLKRQTIELNTLYDVFMRTAPLTLKNQINFDFETEYYRTMEFAYIYSSIAAYRLAKQDPEFKKARDALVYANWRLQQFKSRFRQLDNIDTVTSHHYVKSLYGELNKIANNQTPYNTYNENQQAIAFYNITSAIKTLNGEFKDIFYLEGFIKAEEELHSALDSLTAEIANYTLTGDPIEPNIMQYLFTTIATRGNNYPVLTLLPSGSRPIAQLSDNDYVKAAKAFSISLSKLKNTYIHHLEFESFVSKVKVTLPSTGREYHLSLFSTEIQNKLSDDRLNNVKIPFRIDSNVADNIDEVHLDLKTSLFEFGPPFVGFEYLDILPLEKVTINAVINRLVCKQKSDCLEDNMICDNILNGVGVCSPECGKCGNICDTGNIGEEFCDSSHNCVTKALMKRKGDVCKCNEECQSDVCILGTCCGKNEFVDPFTQKCTDTKQQLFFEEPNAIVPIGASINIPFYVLNPSMKKQEFKITFSGELTPYIRFYDDVVILQPGEYKPVVFEVTGAKPGNYDVFIESTNNLKNLHQIYTVQVYVPTSSAPLGIEIKTAPDLIGIDLLVLMLLSGLFVKLKKKKV